MTADAHFRLYDLALATAVAVDLADVAPSSGFGCLGRRVSECGENDAEHPLQPCLLVRAALFVAIVSLFQ